MSRTVLSTGLGLVALAAIGGGLAVYANSFAHQEVAIVKERELRPRVTLTRPAADAIDVSPLTGLVAEINMPVGAGVDASTLPDGAQLIRTRDGKIIKTVANTTGAGDAVILKPHEYLEPNTQYAFVISDQLKDVSGARFLPNRITFTTAKHVNVSEYAAAFNKIDLNLHMDKDAYTAITIGPDGRLYAGTFAGMIYRYDINADGTLKPSAPIMTVLHANHGPRMIMGLKFDPFHPEILWISHGQMKINEQGKIEGADDWTGKISTVTGPNLETYQDVVIHLPRAYKDHLNFQMDIGADGAVYFNQGSHTSNGDPDKKWGFRKEHALTAAILRLDAGKIKTLPLDVKTDEGGTYDPNASDAPLTVYASGVRSGYDMLWHSNGHLYTAVNGAAGGGGNAPASPDGKTPAIIDVKTTTDDVLLCIEKGAYYGHPNPARHEYTMFGGNPTSGPDVMEVPDYPVGTLPDPRWRPPVFVFGKNFSANGLIEYKSNTFNGALKGCILTTRYSDGDDILTLKLDDAGRVTESIEGITGFTGFTDPLDLIEDEKNGNIYVAEYGGKSLTLLKPDPTQHSDKTVIQMNLPTITKSE